MRAPSPPSSAARGRVVTVAVEGMTFIAPVKVGDVLCVYTSVERVGTTSITIALEAWVRRNRLDDRQKVTEARFVYVALDESGQKRAIPPAERPQASAFRRRSGKLALSRLTAEGAELFSLRLRFCDIFSGLGRRQRRSEVGAGWTSQGSPNNESHHSQEPPQCGHRRCRRGRRRRRLPARRPGGAGTVTSNVNVRSGPGTGYAVVDTVRRGQQVDVQQCQGSWCYVSKPGPDGWVSASYLSAGGSPVNPSQPNLSFGFTIGGGNGPSVSIGVGNNNPPRARRSCAPSRARRR